MKFNSILFAALLFPATAFAADAPAPKQPESENAQLKDQNAQQAKQIAFLMAERAQLVQQRETAENALVDAQAQLQVSQQQSAQQPK